MTKIIIDGVTVFLPEGEVSEEKIRKFIRRSKKGLYILWLSDLKLESVSAIFIENQKVTHIWGLSFSDYGVIVSQNTQITKTENGFSMNGRIGFFGANAMLWGESAKIDNNGIFTFTVHHKGDFDLVKSLDSGIKVSFEHDFESVIEAYEAGFVLKTTSHVLCADMPMDLSIVLDPVNKLLKIFLPENQTFKSSFISVSGKSVGLLSKAGAHFTLATAAQHRYNTNFFHTRYYLTLAGSFLPVFSDMDKTILPGLTGTEYFDFRELTEAIIEFVPGFKAYYGDINEKSLMPTSSYIRYPEGTHYYSQPADAPLFASSNNNGLEFFSVPLLIMDGKTSVPQMFYSEIANIRTDNIEKIVYTDRFDILCNNINCLRNKDSILMRVISPHGLMVGVQDGVWAYISLGNVGTIDSEKLLCLENIDLSLRKSFADVNMNLIFEKADDLTKYVLPESLFSFCLEDIWTIDLNPVSWDETSLLIIKYGTNLTIRELAANNKAFLHALNKTLDDTGNKADEFIPFFEIIDDPKFTGIFSLGLKLSVEESKLNASLKTAWLGINEKDRANIRAHHLIIKHTKATKNADKITQKASSVDATVYYRADKGISVSEEYNAKDYDFRTTSLKLCIRNSKLQSIATESELLINKITDSYCQKENGNCLFLDGRANNKSGLDGFVFILREEGLYTLKSPLEAVRINTVSLTGEGVFSLGGKLYFTHDKNSDLFSFGFDGENDYGLNFTGWKIRNNTNSEFIAQYSDISLLQSSPRNNSWMDSFPIGIDSFCYDISRTPDKCGYINIKTTIAQKKIGYPWYAVRFRVPLGSLGDLNENSAIDLYIIVAWSGGETPGLFVGLRESFFSGIDIEGVIKLGFETIALESTLEGERMHYILSFNQFLARLLWASFPPGKNQIVIEADETGQKLGWLGEYKDTEVEKDGNR